jgi:glutathione S-transferase
LRYLAATLGTFGAKTEAEDWRLQEWLAWEADRLLPGIGRTRFFARFMKTDPAVVDYFRKVAEMGLKMLDDQLAGRDFLLGRRATIADIGCYGALVHAAEGQIELGAWRNIKPWCGRIQSLPGFKPPYDLLPQADRD